jgi:4-hydroxybenzoate polyprenyltransferase
MTSADVHGSSSSSPPPAVYNASPLAAKLALFARDIKLSHSIFALPFALLSTFLAARGWPHLGQLILIVVCMVTARSVAMASNRLLDADLDRQNPRTARRAIPAGHLSRGFFVAILAACAAAFIGATSLFGFVYGNWAPLVLSVPVLVFIGAYPLLKRFTQLSHYYLGLALALAPVCAWIAITGSVDAAPLVMAVAVACWTAGFDIIYACQDFAIDVEQDLYSVPARMGIDRALWVSRATHAVALGALVALGVVASPPLGTLYFIGTTCCALLLIVEHALVRADDLSKVGLAFFTINGLISVLLGTLGIVDVFV